MKGKGKEVFSVSEILFIPSITLILAALLGPIVINSWNRAKLKESHKELIEIQKSVQDLLDKMELSQPAIDESPLDIDLKAEILSSIPLVSEKPEKNVFLLMSDEGKAKMEAPIKKIDEAIKRGKTTITREDAIIIKLDFMDAKIEELANKILTKWDIVQIIFYILGAFAAFSAVCIFVSKIIRRTSGGTSS